MKRMIIYLVVACLAGCTNAGKESDRNDDTAALPLDTAKAPTDNTGVDVDTNVTRLDSVPPNMAGDDIRFLTEAIEHNYAEIKLAQLAAQKSANADIKKVAQTLEREHTEALNKLKSIAQRKSLQAPVSENDKARNKYENFNKKDAAEFDKDWCREMTDEHKSEIKKLEKEWDRLKDPDIRNWISQTLPRIRNHYSELQACEKKLKN
jgi:putative membrane protein